MQILERTSKAEGSVFSMFIITANTLSSSAFSSQLLSLEKGTNHPANLNQNTTQTKTNCWLGACADLLVYEVYTVFNPRAGH